MPKLDGIDVSRYQNAPGGSASTRPQWHLVHKTGLSFVSAKATESSSWVDPEFHANWDEMRQYNDWCRIAYHFATSNSSMKNQALHFRNTVGQNFGPRDGVMVDIETTKYSGPISADNCLALLNEVEQRFQRTPILYMGNFYPNNVDQDARIQRFPWWIPWYRQTQPPWPRTPAIWQWGGASVPGIAGLVDANQVIAPLVLLASCAWPSGSVTPPTPPTQELSPVFNPPQVLAPLVHEQTPPDGKGVWLLGQDGGVYTYGGAKFYGAANGKPYWGTRRASRFSPLTDAERAAGKKYVIQATTGERYAFPE